MFDIYRLPLTEVLQYPMRKGRLGSKQMLPSTVPITSSQPGFYTCPFLLRCFTVKNTTQNRTAGKRHWSSSIDLFIYSSHASKRQVCGLLFWTNCLMSDLAGLYCSAENVPVFVILKSVLSRWLSSVWPAWVEIITGNLIHSISQFFLFSKHCFKVLQPEFEYIFYIVCISIALHSLFLFYTLFSCCLFSYFSFSPTLFNFKRLWDGAACWSWTLNNQWWLIDSQPWPLNVAEYDGEGEDEERGKKKNRM